LVTPSVTYKSFCRYTSYSYPISANDIVQAATAILEIYSDDNTVPLSLNPSSSVVNEKENLVANDQDLESIQSKQDSIHYTATSSSNKDLFIQAYYLLGSINSNNVNNSSSGKKNDNLLKDGIKLATEIQQTIAKKAFAIISSDSFQSLSRLYYVYINASTHSRSSSSSMSLSRSRTGGSALLENEKEFIFGRPNVVLRLGQFIMEVKVRFLYLNCLFVLTSSVLASLTQKAKRMDRVSSFTTNHAIGEKRWFISCNGNITFILFDQR
jgi:hypothetical protein